MATHPNGLTLNQLSDELWRKPVSYSDIDEIIGALEAAGVDLEAPDEAPPDPDTEIPALPEELVRVLTAARALTTETGKRPTADEIARHTGLTVSVVRRALQLGRSATP